MGDDVRPKGTVRWPFRVLGVVLGCGFMTFAVLVLAEMGMDALHGDRLYWGVIPRIVVTAFLGYILVRAGWTGRDPYVRENDGEHPVQDEP